MKASKAQIDLVRGVRREPTSTPVSVLVPIRTKGANAREHWSARSRRVKAERAAVAWALVSHAPVALPCVVILTRLSPGTLDPHDNLPTALKGVVDEITRWLGLASDNTGEVEWQYRQAKTRRAAKGRLADPIGVRIEIAMARAHVG